MPSKFPPVAVCVRCGTYYSHFTDRCATTVNRKQCKGAPRSSIGTDDWITCSQCAGEGRTDAGRCEACQASGFIFVRDRPSLRPKGAQ